MFAGRHAFILLILSAVSLFALGCNKQSDQGDDSEKARRKGELAEIYDVYTTYVKKNQKPPQKLADLTQKEQQNLAPGATRALQSEEYVVVWGADTNTKDGAVLAHQKAAATDGGWVLLHDGTVKHMSASEFNAAPKAK